MKTSHRQSMPFERGSSHPTLLLLVAVAVAIATAAGIVKADVLYDSTAMTDNGTWDVKLSNYISGMGWIGQIRDVQACDNFELLNTYTITNVTADYSMGLGNLPAGGILVEFFEDLGGTPSNAPFAQVFSQEYTATPINLDEFPAFRLSIALDAADVTLVPGIWWIAITPVDETPIGDIFRQVGSTAGVHGNNTHARDGGVAHGNGYAGPHGVDEWTLLSKIGGGLDERDLAMKIEGTAVNPPCPQDLDGNGSVGASDLLSLLASWGPCKGCPEDFDGNGTVGASDLLALLANWGVCP